MIPFNYEDVPHRQILGDILFKAAKENPGAVRKLGQKRRRRAIERIRDRPQQLRLRFLDDAIGGHGGGAGVEEPLLDRGGGLVEAVEHRIDLAQVIGGPVQKLESLRVLGELGRALPKGR